MNIKRSIILLLAVAAAAVMCRPVRAIEATEKLELFVGETRVVKMEGLARLAVGNPAIADVTVFPEDADEAVVNAKAAGITTLYVWKGQEVTPERYELKVSSSSTAMEREVVPLKHYTLSKTNYSDDLRRIETVADEASVVNLKTMLEPILGAGYFSVDVTRNRVIMQGSRQALDAAVDLLDVIDEPLRQVLIEAKVIEISKGDLKRLGNSLLAQKGKAGLTSDLAGDGETFNFAFDTFTDLARRFKITVDTLRTENVGRTLVNPKIAVLDGKTAWIMAGEKIPVATRDNDKGLVSFDYVSTGIILAVTPRVGHDRTITLWIKPEVSNISGWVGNPDSSVDNAAPIINTREVMSEVRVEDGESILIGGLQKDYETISHSKVPVLGNLPLIGSAFRKKRTDVETTELVIIITPHLIDSIEAPVLSGPLDFKELEGLENISAIIRREPEGE